MGSVRISEIPPDFMPLVVRDEDLVTCFGHDGIPVNLGFQITADDAENSRRMAELRASVWWHVQMVRLGIDPDIEGNA